MSKMISVIMPSLLKPYGMSIGLVCATNRRDKLIRAIDSFILQNCHSELILISDECDETVQIYKELYSKFPNIICDRVTHETDFSGKPRTRGLELATGDLICYLDNDDFFGVGHLDQIGNQFTDEVDWVYYNDHIVNRFINMEHYTYKVRDIQKACGHITTGAFAHRNIKGLVWPDGYDHDWRLLSSNFLDKPNKKIDLCSYNTCHTANGGNF